MRTQADAARLASRIGNADCLLARRIHTLTPATNVLSRSKQPIPRQVGDPMRSAHAYLDEGGIARAKPKPLYAFCGNRPPQVCWKESLWHWRLPLAGSRRVVDWHLLARSTPLRSLGRSVFTQEDDDPKMHPRKTRQRKNGTDSQMFSLKERVEPFLTWPSF